MEAWLLWIAAAALLAAAEMLTWGLFLAPLAVGAVLAALLAAHLDVTCLGRLLHPV